MPENRVLNNNYKQVEDSINNALNTLLNEPTSAPLQPKSSNFTTSNQIEGIMGYTFQEEDVIQPVSFLNELRSLTATTTTMASFTDTPAIPISGSAVVTSRLLFNSSSPVPSEVLVLSAVNTLLNSREPKLNQSVKILNVTYEKLSDTSYAIIFTFDLPNISIPEDPVLKNNSYNQVESKVNNALNTLLNEPTSAPLQPKSANFTSTSNQFEGNMGYTFQDEDIIQPVSFLNELRSLTVVTTTSASSTVTSAIPISGSVLVTSRLLFNSSSPVPSEALVLSAVNTLLNSREPKLNQSVKIVNVTYEKLSDTSYAIIFTLNSTNIRMPEDPALKNNNYKQVEDSINNALNNLLNEPTSAPLLPKSTNFTRTSNQIVGIMGYTFQDEDVIQPVSFLNELRSQTAPTTTTASSTPAVPISGPAVVTSRLLFNSLSPVPSEALVLSAVNTLLNSRESQLNESVKIVNVTYEKHSDTSYAIIFTFNLIKTSMPEDPVLKNKSYKQVEDSVNNALNTLLNEPTSAPLQPKTSNFTSTSYQIEGNMGYAFQDEDVIQPASFLNKLRSQTVPTTTTASSTVTPAIPISGSAVVTSRLLFDSSSPVPSEALVLNAVNTLLTSRDSQLNDSVKVVNVTYEQISESSYALTFKFNIIQLSMPSDSELRNNTYLQVEDTINKALNTLVNEPNSPTLKPKSSNFKSALNYIEGSLEYAFPKDDVLQPISFLHQLSLLTVTTTTSSLTTATTSPPTLMGVVTIFIKLQFITLGPIPSETSIISLVNSVITSRLQTKDVTTQNMNADYVNVTYNRISDSSYVLIFEFKINNVPMYETFGLRNETYVQIQTSINNLLPKVLNDTTPPQIELNQVVFNNSNNEIQANVQFVFSQSNINTTSTLVKEILKANEVITTSAPALTTASTLLITSPPTLLGKVVIYISLVFKTKGTLPSQNNVLQMANSLLLRFKLKSKRSITEKELQDLVNGVNVTYTKLDDTSFSLNFGFEISNVTMSEKVELRNDTYIVIQTYINSFVSKILNKTTTVDFNFNHIAFMSNSSIIEANVTYTFSDSDVGAFGLVTSILGASTTPAPTTTYPTVLNTTISSNSTNAAWVVAIIVPCAIVIMLVPCWILLCCLLCGCCAAIRRRWHRRQSYNVQYTTRNSLF